MMIDIDSALGETKTDVDPALQSGSVEVGVCVFLALKSLYNYRSLTDWL